MAWPIEHDDLLRKCKSEGVSYQQIAMALNRTFRTNHTKGTVAGRLRALGLSEPRTSDKPVAQRPKRVILPRPIIARPAPAPLEHPDPIDLSGNNGALITLLDLKPGQCRYPFGEGPFHFCGEPQCGEGQVYCAEHYRVTRRHGENVA